MNVLWLKRDIRLKDHLPLKVATEGEFIIIYIFEPSISSNYDFDIRHWQFVYQSILDLEKQGVVVHKLYAEAFDIFKYLHERYGEIIVYSHQETGNALSFKRDTLLKQFFVNNNIEWHEFAPYGVVRGKQTRDRWDHQWLYYVQSPIIEIPKLNNLKTDIKLMNEFLPPHELRQSLKEIEENRLKGGELSAHKCLDIFLSSKIEKYWGSLSYPEKSRYYYSGLSAYISWGNISIKIIYQMCKEKRPYISNRNSVDQFMGRLKWHCHFIQKLESEPRLEFENLNKAFNQIRQKKNKKLINAWKSGQTGYPLIDAAMRCVHTTGYLNFRLRSTVVSFLTHILWQPWQAGAGFLARKFLDYEPGIHFSQFQMQAGTTGVNTIRIYNPIKQSLEKDKEAIFIKKWVPELRELPTYFAHRPWEMSAMDQLLYQFKLGEDYPTPIVDFEKEQKKARETLWKMKKSDLSRNENKAILSKHVRRNKKRYQPKKFKK